MPERRHIRADHPSCDIQVVEAASPRARVIGVAYTGGKMRLAGWKHPVVVDLSGLEIPAQVPLLANHENRTGSRVGMARAKVESGQLVMEGEILSSSGVATGIVEQARAGADWQLSISADVHKAELVRDKREVNGRIQSGPFYHVQSATLVEVSVVAIGADTQTHMRVAATWELKCEGDVSMDFEAWLEKHDIDAEGLSDETVKALRAAFEAGEAPPELDELKAAGEDPQDRPDPSAEPAPRKVTAGGSSDAGDVRQAAAQAAEEAVKAERKRVAAIRAVCDGDHDELEAKAISEGWDVSEVTAQVLEAVRAARPQIGPSLTVLTPTERRKDAQSLEAALCLRAGMPEKQLTEDFGDQVMEAAWQDREISLPELMRITAQMEGKSVPRTFGKDTIRAAFSTVSLPGILNNVANKGLLRSYRDQPLVATRLCSEGELSDFKESERYRLTDVGDLQPVAPDGELKHGGVTEEKATNQLATYGKLFALTRQMIYNDDLNAFLKIPAGMGARAARKIDQLFFTRLLSNPTMEDGTALFHADHNNYSTGASTALSIDSLATAVQMFMNQTDADGQPINIAPAFLVVPTALKMSGRELLNSTMLVSVGSTDRERLPTYNPIVDEDLTLVASPYLANKNYTGYSALAWYLWGDPAVVDTFEIGYLRGNRTPTVEQTDTDFNTLGIQFRVYFDVGVREQDFRGVVKMKGKA